MTKIEWTEETYNPIIGCSKISPGCDNCYAERMAGRLANMRGVSGEYAFVVESNEGVYPHDWKAIGKWNGETRLVESALEKPLHWKKPRTIFVSSMGDLFHKSVSDGWITAVLEIIQKCPQHTFQVLTKRPRRMEEYFDRLDKVMQHGVCNINFLPLPNLWLGVTAENQEQADKRIPILLRIPATKRFVSIEPMLGPVDLSQINISVDRTITHNVLTGIPYDWDYGEEIPENRIDKLDWVICGGESGPGARPMHPEWVLNLLAQCKGAEVPFFFKQWGEWSEIIPMDQFKSAKFVYNDGTFADQTIERGRNATAMIRCGKKKAGHLISDKEIRERP